MIKTLKKLLTSNTETEVLEFKQTKNQFDKNKLGKYFSALRNKFKLEQYSSCDKVFLIIDFKKSIEI